MPESAHGSTNSQYARSHLDHVIDAKSVEFFPGLPVYFPELRGHFISVVATGEDGRIAWISNRCGIAAEWCLAAPGDNMRLAYFGPHPDNNSPNHRGTYTHFGAIYAAPMVTGGLVVMKQYFRDQLSNTALVSRLLETANDRGIYADSAIYGHGLMDLGAATAPVGTASFALGERVDGAASPAAQTRVGLGGAFGDGLTQAFADREVAAFDTLGAPFWYSLDSFASAAPGRSALSQLRAFMASSRADGRPETEWPWTVGFAHGGNPAMIGDPIR